MAENEKGKTMDTVTSATLAAPAAAKAAETALREAAQAAGYGTDFRRYAADLIQTRAASPAVCHAVTDFQACRWWQVYKALLALNAAYKAVCADVRTTCRVHGVRAARRG
jgi:hypothetical protein